MQFCEKVYKSNLSIEKTKSTSKGPPKQNKNHFIRFSSPMLYYEKHFFLNASFKKYLFKWQLFKLTYGIYTFRHEHE